jgi:hypothetical protein
MQAPRPPGGPLIVNHSYNAEYLSPTLGSPRVTSAYRCSSSGVISRMTFHRVGSTMTGRRIRFPETRLSLPNTASVGVCCLPYGHRRRLRSQTILHIAIKTFACLRDKRN